MKYIQPFDRDQLRMLSSMDDLVPQDHAVRIMDMIVESILTSNKARFEKAIVTEAGRPRYHSMIFLKLFLYGYFNGISSSRKLEVETYRNNEVIWLLGGLKPDHWTISNYRKDNSDEIKFVTKKFREFLKKLGYISLKKVAIDGSKVKANANREMLTLKKIEKRLRGIDKKIEEYLMKIAKSDERDELLDEDEEDEGSPPDVGKYIDKIIELEKQLEKLKEQKELLEKENRKQRSPSDPEANLMKSRDGLVPAYNVQIAVDAENKMIADSEVEDSENDLTLLPEMIKSLKEEYGEVPEEALMDKGYNTPDLIEEVEKAEGVELYVAVPRSLKDNEEVKFSYDGAKDEYVCPEGKSLVLIQKNKIKHKSLTNVYRCNDCDGCRIREKCTKAKKGRMVHRYLNQEWRDQYKSKMESKLGREKIVERKLLVEHPFGTIKYLMGKIPLLLRGKKKVGTEINLYTTAYNLKRLLNIELFDIIVAKVMKYQWAAA